MRRIALLLVLLAATFAGATVPVTGTARDLGGNPVKNVYWLFELWNTNSCEPHVISTPGVIAETKYKIEPNATGVISKTIVPNNDIECFGTTNTQYRVTKYVNGVQSGRQYIYQVTGLFDLNSPPPPTGSIAPPNPPSPLYLINNPLSTQTVTQPPGTRFQVNGDFLATGNFQATNFAVGTKVTVGAMTLDTNGVKGNSGAMAADGSGTTIEGGSGVNGGGVTVRGGDATAGGDAGAVYLRGGDSGNKSGDIVIQAGGNGWTPGDVQITPGTSSGGIPGKVYINGPIVADSLNGVPVVTPTDSLQTAINSLPAMGGAIQISSGSYNIPLGSVVVNKPVRFICDSPYSTVLNFTGTTGNAFSFEYTTDPYGNVQQWGASIENCSLVGPGGINGSGNAGTGISLGTATLAPTGVRILNSVIAGFSKAMTWGTGSATYLEVAHSVFANNTQDLPYDPAVNAGTNATFDDVKFVNWASSMAANKLIFSGAAGGKFVFKNCGFNNSQVVVSAPGMFVFFDNSTFENDNGNTTLNYFVQTAGTSVMKAPLFLQHYATGSVPDAFVAVSGGAISIDEWVATTAQTMTSAFKFSGNTNWNLGRQVTGVTVGGSTGFTNDAVNTSTGYSTYINRHGSFQFYPDIEAELQPMMQVGKKNSYNVGEVDLPSDLRLTGYSAGTPTAFVSAADTSGTHDLDLTFRVQNAGSLVDALRILHGAGGATSVEVLGPLTVGGATPTVTAGKIGIGTTTTSTVGAAGGASALPATPSGYLVINIGGTNYKIPYFAN